MYNVRKPNHCRRCGNYINGQKYNPYNITFKIYACDVDDKKMCHNCAKLFVKESNKCKGGVWELESNKENTEG